MSDDDARLPRLAALAPPVASASGRLCHAVSRRTARRLARLRRLTIDRGPDRLGRRVAQVAACLRALPPGVRRGLLHGPDLRGFLSEAETWIEVAGLARAARRSPGGPAVWNRLFDRISRTEHLVTLVPRGRVDPGLAERARRFAMDRLAALDGDLGAFLLGVRLAHGDGRDDGAPIRLRAGAAPEQGRPAQRIDLGTLGGLAGPLGIEFAPRRPGTRDAPVRATIRRGALFLAGPDGLTVFPAAASALRFPAAGAPRPPRPLRGSTRLVRRRLIPGTSVLLAPSLRSSPRRLAVEGDLPGLEVRLARALRLVRLAWPAGHREILARTAMVVPIREAGLVSYSLAARPGVSFINVAGKSTLDLADDLLHESAHHLLHDLQETTSLLRPGPETEEVQAFDSPWRGVRRPLHGLLHGAYTFLFRAELFARVLAVRRRLPRVLDPLLGPGGASLVRRELRREIDLCARAHRDLEVAARAGLLTPAGRALVRALVAWRRRLEARRS